MRKIPNDGDVRRALRATMAAVGKARKGANRVAGEALAKGRYDEAELLTHRARQVEEFLAEVKALAGKWSGLRSSGVGSTTSKQEATPLWSYYQPILRALVERGGASTRAELEPIVESLMGDRILPGDRQVMSGGRPRWRVMIGLSRKQLMSEGWLEKGSGKVWRITPSGKRAAAREVERQRSTG